METLVEKVLMYGDTQAEKEAICFKNIIVTYGELKKRVEGMASILHGMGIEKGHRVMLNAVSKPEYIVGLLAIQYIGAVTVAIDKYAKPDNVYDIWKMTQAPSSSIPQMRRLRGKSGIRRQSPRRASSGRGCRGTTSMAMSTGNFVWYGRFRSSIRLITRCW